MREIKFRAWHRIKKEWLFGYEIPNLGGFSLIGETVLLGELNSIPLLEWNDVAIMQYTGLKDKNSKEIYEGDVVYGDISHSSGIEVVEYMGGGFSPFAVPKWEMSPNPDEVEVIGNIYENPELLK